MIIDIHTRIGRHPIHEFKQKPSELLKIMDKHDITKSFLHPFPTMKIEENNDMVAGAFKEHPDRFIGFAGINPVADDAQEELDRVIGLGFKGLMIDPEFHKEIFRRFSKVEELMVSCLENRLPVLFNTDNISTQTRQKPFYVSLDKLAFKFPSVRFIVSFRWLRVEELMRAHENIYLYTGGHHNTPGIIPILEEVGPLRICMGTESPVNHPGLTIMDLKYKKIPEKYGELILGKKLRGYLETYFKDFFSYNSI